jgi:DNA-3-methyladenine glycosylase II
LTPVDYARARRLLARRDPVIRDLIRQHGDCGLADAQHTEPFKALTHAIISQQLSTKAAATIARRFDALFGTELTPRRVAAVDDSALRAVGLSVQKIRYIRDLCARIEDASLPLQRLETLPDDAVIDALTQVKGIGRAGGRPGHRQSGAARVPAAQGTRPAAAHAHRRAVAAVSIRRVLVSLGQSG